MAALHDLQVTTAQPPRSSDMTGGTVWPRFPRFSEIGAVAPAHLAQATWPTSVGEGGHAPFIFDLSHDIGMVPDLQVWAGDPQRG